jgi:hypothetical protein
MSHAHRRNVAGIAAGLALLFTASTIVCAQAGETIEPNSEEVGSALSAELGVDFSNMYFFRGILQEDDGLITQPWVEIGIDLLTEEDRSLAAKVGVWSSFHGSTGTAGTSDEFTEHWYENDFYAGLVFDVGEWSFDLTHTYYTSPSDAFSTIGEVSFGVSYDDSSLWGETEFALNPHITAAFETDDRGGSEDAYLELGIEPGWEWELGETTLEMALPLTIGLSLDEYYVDSNGDDETFGYVDLGVTAGLPLPVSTRYGEWSLSGGVHLLYLGDATSDINGDDDLEVFGILGVSVSF